MKKLWMIILALVVMLVMVGCDPFADEADVAARNVSEDADNFKVSRQIIFYNSITDTYMWTFEGYCSIHADEYDAQLEVTCKVGPSLYSKHFLGLSDNVSYMVIQTEEIYTDPYHFKIYVRPEAILPDFEFVTSSNDDDLAT